MTWKSPTARYYCAERRALINNLTARNLFQIEGINFHLSITSEDGDISDLFQFAWYEWCYYHVNTAVFPIQQEILGRVLGPSKGKVNEMAQWILKANGCVVPRCTTVPLTNDQLNSETEKNKRTIFYHCISKQWGNSISPTPIMVDTTT